MSDEISHAEASTYVPSSEPGPSSEHDHAAPVTREIKERAYEAIVISEDVSTEDFAEEMANRKAEEAGEELSSSRKQARRERNNAQEARWRSLRKIRNA
jgi:hypothetical protein